MIVDTKRGTLTEPELRSRTQARDNRITLYQPAGLDTSARYPLLIVHDGGDYLGYASMKIILDNLIDDGRLATIIVRLPTRASGSPSIPTILIMPNG